MMKKKRVVAEETRRGSGQEELEQAREVATRPHLSNAMSKREHKKKGVKEHSNKFRAEPRAQTYNYEEDHRQLVCQRGHLSSISSHGVISPFSDKSFRAHHL